MAKDLDAPLVFNGYPLFDINSSEIIQRHLYLHGSSLQKLDLVQNGVERFLPLTPNN
jgi:hypothetical protein